jgi:putative ABC transport system substrate-binding protein
MRRRELMLLCGGFVMLPGVLRAQQKAMPVIGFLHFASPGPSATYRAVFRQGLSETGYIEGQNVAIEYRWAGGEYDRLPALAADLVGRKVDVIATFGLPSALAAKSATSTIPIVFSVGDPVERGLVASLARPGGNLTGVSTMGPELISKRLELLSELVPQAGVSPCW